MIHIGLHPEPGGLSVRGYLGGIEAPYLSGFHGEIVKWWLVLMSNISNIMQIMVISNINGNITIR